MTEPKEKKKPGIKVKVEVEVEVPQQWIDYGTQYNDLFRQGEIGYWAFGVERFKTGGWLVWEFEDDKRPLPGGCSYIDQLSDAGYKKHHGAAIKAYKANKPLPEHYHRLDKDAMIRAFVEGCKLWGIDWYENSNTDSNSYDEVVQRALLGKVKYG
jgi:hypothetical protein